MNENEKTQNKRITFKMEPSENHISFISNRIFGGLQGGNLFELNFLMETRPLPNELTVDIAPDGTQKEISLNQKDEIIRKNQATAYLTIETLFALRDWLDERIDEFETLGIVQKNDDVEYEQ